MKTLRKFCFIVMIIIIQGLGTSVNGIFAQENSPNQIGLRLGGYSGMSYRHWGNKNRPNIGFEISLMGWAPYHGALLSGMIEKNMPIKNNFYFYFGGGLFFSNYEYRPYYYKIDDKWYFYEHGGQYFGLEGVVGCDYYITKVPIVVGLDLRPRLFNVIYPYIWDTGLNVRYRF